MYSQLADYCQEPPSRIKEEMENSGWKEQYERGEIDSRALFHKLSPAIQGSQGFIHWMNAISDIFTVNDALVPLIKELKEKKVSLFTLSNLCEAHFGYAYLHCPILHLFEGHILSYEAKARKPDIKIYEEALKKASVSKEQIFCIDSIPEYVEKTKELGIDSEIYVDLATLRKQLEERGVL